MSITTEKAFEPLIEPLSAASGKHLRRLELFPNDFLQIDLSDDAKSFIVRPLNAKRVDLEYLRGLVAGGADKQDVADQSFQKDGEYYHISKWSASGRLYNWLGTVFESKSIDGRSYALGATDTTCLLIMHAVGEEHIRWKSPEAKILYTDLIRRFTDQTVDARIIADWKINGVLPELPADFVQPTRPLMPQQQVGLAISLERPVKALFMEQGTGKSATVVSRVQLEAVRKRSGSIEGLSGIYRCLIVCPRQVRTNWKNEFETFSTTKGKVAILRGGEMRRANTLIEAIKDDGEHDFVAVVVPWDTVNSMLPYLKRVPWDLGVWDESHMAKSYRSKRSKANRELSNGPFMRQTMILTGTPIANTANDLFAQFELLAEGCSGFSSMEKFRKFYGKYKKLPDTKGVEKLIGIQNIPLLQERLARMAFMITKKEARMNLPDKVYSIREVYMTAAQKKVYKALAEQLAAEIEGMDETVSVSHILTMLLRLGQITSGFVKPDRVINPETLLPEGKGQPINIGSENPKITELLNILTSEERDPNGKTIVWATYVHNILEIEKALTSAGLGCVTYYGGTSDKDREEAIRRFNEDPNCRVFIANPAAAGAGLNLVGYDYWNDVPTQETYTDLEVFFSQNWSAIERSQAEDRAHRKGTRQPVEIIDLVVPGTIDEEIRARVTSKLERAMQLQDIRDILNQVLDLEGEE